MTLQTGDRGIRQGAVRCDEAGGAVLSILATDKPTNARPRLQATFLLWLLCERVKDLPKPGDPDKPKLMFFCDAAHPLFRPPPKALIFKVEQVARLIRCKGVGVG